MPVISRNRCTQAITNHLGFVGDFLREIDADGLRTLSPSPPIGCGERPKRRDWGAGPSRALFDLVVASG
jgi:hypothetical protein